jgi:hypothetical protein
MEKKSKHAKAQQNKFERLRGLVYSVFSETKHFHMTAERHSERMNIIIYDSEDYKRSVQSTRDYLAGMRDAMWQELTRGHVFLYRDPVSLEVFPADWNNMTEAQRELCRNGKAEANHCWDSEGLKPWGTWESDASRKEKTQRLITSTDNENERNANNAKQ